MLYSKRKTSRPDLQKRSSRRRRRNSQKGGRLNKDTCGFAYRNPSWKNAPMRVACRALYGAPISSSTRSIPKGVALNIRPMPGTGYTTRTIKNRNINPAFMKTHGILDTRTTRTSPASIKSYLKSRSGTTAGTARRSAAMTAAVARLAERRKNAIYNEAYHKYS